MPVCVRSTVIVKMHRLLVIVVVLDFVAGNFTSTDNGNLLIKHRQDWLAQPPTGPMTPLQLPVPYVIVSHTASGRCSSTAQCTKYMRDLQNDHKNVRGWLDISYNFLVGGDGHVYVGRGWDNAGAHSSFFNNCSVGISFIGMFQLQHPTAEQMQAAEMLMAEGVMLGKIRPDYRLLGHRQVSKTLSPGDALYADLKKSPHHSATPVVQCRNVHAKKEQPVIKGGKVLSVLNQNRTDIRFNTMG